MIIRKAVAADIAPASALLAQAYATHFRPIIGEVALGFDQRHFEVRFVRELEHLTVLDEGGIRGVLLLKDGHIVMLFVSEAGHGNGAALLAHAEANGARSLEVFAANERARRFYERAGWQAVHEYSREFAGADHRFLRYEKPVPPDRNTSPHPEEPHSGASKDDPESTGSAGAPSPGWERGRVEGPPLAGWASHRRGTVGAGSAPERPRPHPCPSPYRRGVPRASPGSEPFFETRSAIAPKDEGSHRPEETRQWTNS